MYVQVLPPVCTQGSEDILGYPALSLPSLFFEKRSFIDPGARLAARKPPASFVSVPSALGLQAQSLYQFSLTCYCEFELKSSGLHSYLLDYFPSLSFQIFKDSP